MPPYTSINHMGLCGMVNVFVASYRFNRSMVDLYRLTFPFVVIMALGLLIVDGTPKISTFAIERRNGITWLKTPFFPR